MRDDDIDRILSLEQEIVPSAGFATAVMDAVRQEASMPPPIPFPWMRVWAGLVVGAVACVAGSILLLATMGRVSAPRPPLSIATVPADLLLRTAIDAGAHWLVLALVLTLASVVLSKRLSAGRA